MISEDATLGNGAGDSLFVGTTRDSEFRRGLLTFGIAGQVPPGATVVSATLELHLTRRANGSATVLTLHRVTADWGSAGSNSTARGGGGGAPALPGDATWSHRFYSTTTWVTPGGDFVVTPTSQSTVTVEGTYIVGSTSLMISDVQTWVDHPSTNFGWELIGDETTRLNAMRFASMDNPDASLRPVLRLVFQLPSASCTANTANQQPLCWRSSLPIVRR